MKKKFLAILLGALLVMSMLPMGILADKNVMVTPNLNSGNYFLKMEKTGGTSYQAVLTFPFIPEADVEYKASFDIRVEKGNPVSFIFGFVKGDTYDSSYIDGAHTTMQANTNGWVTKELSFTGRELTDNELATSPLFKFGFMKSSKAGVLYLDNVKLYKVSDPETNLLPNPGFEDEFGKITVRVGSSAYDNNFVVPSTSYGYSKTGQTNAANLICSQVTSDTAVIPDTTKFYNYDFTADTDYSATFKYKTGHEVERIVDPVNDGNYVLKSSGTVTDTVKVIPSFTPGLGQDTILKLSFKMYVPSEQTTLPTDKTFRVRVNKGTSIYSGKAIAYPSVDTWTEYEYYLNCVPTGDSIAGYIEAGGQYVYYLDDIKLEYFNNEGYVSDMQVVASSYDRRTGAAHLVTKGVKPAVYTKDSVIQPVVIYDPDTVGSTALVFNALYSVNGEQSTLIDIKATTVTPVAMAGFTSSTTLKNSGIVYSSDLALSLSGLDAGNYEVKTFVWNNTNLQPIVDRTSTFTIAAE